MRLPAFDKLKEAMISATHESAVDSCQPYHLYTDASKVCVGATLAERCDHRRCKEYLRPIAFMPCKIKSAKTRYPRRSDSPPRGRTEKERLEPPPSPDADMEVTEKRKPDHPPATSAGGLQDLERGNVKPPAFTRSTGTSTTDAESDRLLMPTPAPKQQASYKRAFPNIPAPAMQQGKTPDEWSRDLEVWGSWQLAVCRLSDGPREASSGLYGRQRGSKSGHQGDSEDVERNVKPLTGGYAGPIRPNETNLASC